MIPENKSENSGTVTIASDKVIFDNIIGLLFGGDGTFEIEDVGNVFGGLHETDVLYSEY